MARMFCKNFLGPITHLSETCVTCGDIDVFMVETQDLHDWKNGKSIKDVLCYLSDDQHQLLITGKCSKCRDIMCG